MLLAELHRREPELVPVLRCRAVAWCLDNGRPREALEYSIAADDVDSAARLIEKLWLPTYQQGRRATLQRWLRWLEDRGGIEGHPMIAVWASGMYAMTGQPVDAERWADAVDRERCGYVARVNDLAA
jgi:LuxR family maltose regulon positive regulatory protein